MCLEVILIESNTVSVIDLTHGLVCEFGPKIFPKDLPLMILADVCLGSHDDLGDVVIVVQDVDVVVGRDAEDGLLLPTAPPVGCHS